jgi:hypothetical protein
MNPPELMLSNGGEGLENSEGIVKTKTKTRGMKMPSFV